MKKITIVLNLFLLLVYTNSYCQETEWRNTFGGSGNDEIFSIIKSNDGNFILGGHSSSDDGDITNHIGSTDFWLVKISDAGDIIWEQSYGSENSEYMRTSLTPTNDNGLIFGGNTSTNSSSSDFYVIKIDDAGAVEWEKTYGGSGDDFITSILELNDGGFLVGGASNSSDGDLESNAGEFDFWLIRIDALGNLIWSKTYGGEGFDYILSLNQSSEEEYILAGYSDSYINVAGFYGDDDYRIIKIDGDGNILWERSYGGSEEDRLSSSLSTDDNGVLLFGGSFSNDGDITENIGISDFWLVKIDSDGEIEWDKNFGGTSGEIPRGIIKTSDNGYILTGSTYSDDVDVTNNNSSSGNRDMWVIKIDETGNRQWDANFGGILNDWTMAIAQIDDESYMLGGVEFGVNDYIVIRFNAEGVVSNQSISQDDDVDLHVYPNPGYDEIRIKSTENIVDLEILDEIGSTVFYRKINSQNFTVNTMSLSKGIYFIRANTSDNTFTRKIIIR